MFHCYMQEEWVVCRVFQKSAAAVKKPQHTPSSQPSDESLCDTNSMVNEFGDIELPNLNGIANLTSGFGNIPSTHSYSSDNSNVNNMNMTNNMNLNMNWAAASLPSLTWPSSLLSPNLSMNSLLLKALQYRNYQAREATSNEHNSFLQQQGGINSRFESDLSSNFQASSSSKVILDSVVPQQTQQEQPFNLDSIW